MVVEHCTSMTNHLMLEHGGDWLTADQVTPFLTSVAIILCHVV